LLKGGYIGFGNLNGSVIKYDHVPSRLHNPTKSALGKYGSRNNLSSNEHTLERVEKPVKDMKELDKNRNTLQLKISPRP
jgi:hypothetical protein